jgi:hypothetical protein
MKLLAVLSILRRTQCFCVRSRLSARRAKRITTNPVAVTDFPEAVIMTLPLIGRASLSAFEELLRYDLRARST